MSRKNNIFNNVQVSAPQRSKFDLSHEVKLTMDMGPLVPVYLEEILPGDSFRMSSEVFIRMQPMLAPIMARVNARLDFFFVPNRIIWDEFEDFITGGPQGNLAPLAPFYTFNDANKGFSFKATLGDYFGLPSLDVNGSPIINAANNQKISTLPFRAYQTIYNEYYRDQNLITEVPVPKTSGDDSVAMNDIGVIQQRAWEKDYFTSALPWAQRGAAVGLPFGNASVTYMAQSKIKNAITNAEISNNAVYMYAGTTTPAGPLTPGTGLSSGGGSGAPVRLENIASIALSGTINDLRRSLKLQEWLEKSAVGGARYIEQNRIHFGVKSSDARLQRPEYLGGGKSAVQISEVLSTVQLVDATTGDPEGLPQGAMAGHGVSYSGAGGFKARFEEHGWVLGILSVIPATVYQQGIPRKFQRFDKFDYPWPEFAHIGEQPIFNRELYFTGVTGTNPNNTFGYQSRYAEMKYRPSYSAGDMKDNLDFWNLDRIFINEPALNGPFVEAFPSDRIFAVSDGSSVAANTQLIVQVYHKVDALRPLPYYGTPML